MSTPPDAPVEPPSPEPAPDWEGRGWTPFARVTPAAPAVSSTPLAAPLTAPQDDAPVVTIALPTQLDNGGRVGRAERLRAEALLASAMPETVPEPAPQVQPPTFGLAPSPELPSIARGPSPLAPPAPAPPPAEPPFAKPMLPTTLRRSPEVPAARSRPDDAAAAESLPAGPAADAEAAPSEHSFARPGGPVPSPADKLIGSAPPPPSAILPPQAQGQRRTLPRPSRRAVGALAVLAATAGAAVPAMSFLQHRPATPSRQVAPATAPAVPPATAPRTLAAPGRTASATGKVALVTPAEADRVLRSLWRARESMALHHDALGLGAVEAGPALRHDAANARCSCGPRRSGTYAGHVLWVPRQTRYPISFTAEVATSEGGGPFTEVLLVRRQSAALPWQLVLDTGWAPAGRSAGLDAAVTDADGYSRPVASGLRRRAAAAPIALAALWRRAVTTGKPGHSATFAAGLWTTARAQALAKHRSGAPQGNGATATVSVAVDREAPVTVVRTAGGALSCAAVTVTSTYAAPPPQDAGRRTWGPDIAPGPHASITSVETWQSCSRVPSDGLVQVLGRDGSRAPVRHA